MDPINLHQFLDFFSFLFGQAVFEQWVIFVIIFAILIGILVRWEIGIFEGNRGSVRRHFLWTLLIKQEAPPPSLKVSCHALCLKIAEKIAFNIASEASNVYILSGQKLIENAKNGPLWRVFEKLKLAVRNLYVFKISPIYAIFGVLLNFRPLKM